MRLFKLKTSLLALIFGLVGEVVCIFGGQLLLLVFPGSTIVYVWQWFYSRTHWPALALTHHICATIMNVPEGWATIIFIVAALLEWWVILFASMWTFRHFHRKSA